MSGNEFNFTFRDILNFIDIVKGSVSKEVKILDQFFYRDIKNYESINNFLQKIKIIEIASEKINLNFDLADQKDEYFQSLFKERLILYLEKFPLLNHFILHFKEINGQLVYRPDLKDNLLFSKPRNFLIEINALDYNTDNSTYILDEDFLPFIESQDKEHKLSNNELENILKKQTILGRLAEERVIKFEIERLNKAPKLIKSIKHVALENVSAGYDIKSCELNGSPRYIEVKAVSVQNYEFNWSANEIKVAKVFKGKYFLYLLPVLKNNIFDTDSMLIIANPYKNVFYNEKSWSRTEKAYTIWKSDLNK